jgi:valyl-tRNA synthetase
MMQLEDAPVAPPPTLGIADRWIRSRLAAAIAEIGGDADSPGAFGEYRFNDAAARLYEFTWHEFCDWYIEMSKITLAEGGDAAAATRHTLGDVLECLMRLLHPIVPFISEEIWQALVQPAAGTSICTARYPDGASAVRDPEAEARIGRLIEIVRAVRNIRAEMRIPPGRALDVTLVLPDDAVRTGIAADETMLRTLARIETLAYRPPGTRLRGAATAIVDDIEILVPLEGIVDLEAEATRLAKEIGKVTGELAGVERKLADPKFRSRAPEAIVEEQEQKAAAMATKKATLERSLKTLDDARAG